MTSKAVRLLIITALTLGTSVLALGCESTQFFDEGPGQPTQRASGRAPAGSIGACRVGFSRRPPIVNKALWDNLKTCGPKTPSRYLRLGYGRTMGNEDPTLEWRMRTIMEALKTGESENDGNAKMLGMLRTVRRLALNDAELSARVERASGRTFACDYTYLLNATNKEYQKLDQGDPCPAYAYDPKLRQEVCLFEPQIKEARWITSPWSCMAFTGTVGEGGSCYRLCSYDDYCAAQVNCAQPDFNLVLCALGVCMPESVVGILR